MKASEAKSLIELRSIRGLTQSDVASKLGMTQQGYGLIERGERDLRVRMANKLAELFGVKISVIISLAPKNNGKTYSSTGTDDCI
jgi:transcriptional regulator with XRE-family HTH domain